MEVDNDLLEPLDGNMWQGFISNEGILQIKSSCRLSPVTMEYTKSSRTRMFSHRGAENSTTLNCSGLELIPIGNAHLLWYCMCTWISIKGQNNQLESPQPDPPNKNYQHHASSWNVTVTIHVRSDNHFSPASSIIILLKDLSFTLIPLVSGHLQSSIYHIEGFGRFPPSKPTLRNILHLLHHLAMSSLRFRSSEKKKLNLRYKKDWSSTLPRTQSLGIPV